MPISGTVIAESLHGDAVLDLPLTLTRIQRVGVTGSVAGQPSTWTLIHFTCPDEDADRLAEQLAEALAPGAWYTDYATEAATFVIFAGRIFTYPRGDVEGRAAAVAYAHSVGVPDTQLDWPA